MKIKNLIITSVSVATLTFLTSCSSPEKKVEHAQEEVNEANEDLVKANQEYLADIETYRLNTADRIAANEKNIIEFNARIEAKKKDATEDYKKKVADLENKNNDMKKRMADYKVDSKENWENFKREFNRDMDDLGHSFENLSTRKTK